MRRITRAELATTDLAGPVRTPEGDLFSSDLGLEILLREEDGFPIASLRGADGGEVLVEEEGAPMDPEALSALLWERLEAFDEVIERLAGPLPEI